MSTVNDNLPIFASMQRLKFDKFLSDALKLWDSGEISKSLSILRDLVEKDYLPAFHEYLWRIWGHGNYYDEFTATLERGISLGSHDCEYIRIWKEYSNRPGDAGYWTEIKRLASLKQKNAMLALGLNEFLHGNRERGIRLVCDARGARSWEENISYMMRKSTPAQRVFITSLAGPVRLMQNVEFESYPTGSLPIVHYKNAYEMTNEEFNSTIFTELRNLEKKRIQKMGDDAFSYRKFREMFKQSGVTSLGGAIFIEGLSKNAWSIEDENKESEAERHSMYITKKTTDGKWMTLRIGDHTSNLGDYFKYRRMYVPSSRPYANLCIMLHGDREQTAGMKYSFRFRAATADPCVTVRDEDFQVYRPFDYEIVHYVPGLIEHPERLISAIKQWLDGDGLLEFRDPFLDDDVCPTARIIAGPATIETWDIKYARRRREAEAKNIEAAESAESESR